MICTKSEMFDLLADKVAMLEFDLDAEVITWASRPLEELFGYSLRGSLEALPVEVLLPDAARKTHEGHRRDYAKHPETRTMSTRPLLEGKRKDGSTFPVVVGLYPGMAGPLSNRRRVVLAIVFDMTEREFRRPPSSHRTARQEEGK